MNHLTILNLCSLIISINKIIIEEIDSSKEELLINICKSTSYLEEFICDITTDRFGLENKIFNKQEMEGRN